MDNENMKVFVDPAAPLVAKIEEAEEKGKGKYKLNREVYGKIFDVYQSLMDIVEDSDGRVTVLSTEPGDLVRITAKTSSYIELGGERFKGFRKLLQNVYSLKIDTIPGEDNLVIQVCFDGLWEVAE